MAIDCALAQFALNLTFADVKPSVRSIFNAYVCAATYDAISKPEFLNPTLQAVNLSVKKLAVNSALYRVQRNKPADLSACFTDAYTASDPFNLVYHDKKTQHVYQTRSKTQYADNTTTAVKFWAPKALKEVRCQLEKRVSPLTDYYEDYVRNLEKLLEKMGMQ